MYSLQNLEIRPHKGFLMVAYRRRRRRRKEDFESKISTEGSRKKREVVIATMTWLPIRRAR